MKKIIIVILIGIALVLLGLFQVRASSDSRAQVQIAWKQIGELAKPRAETPTPTQFCHTFAIDMIKGDEGEEVTSLVTALRGQGFILDQTSVFNESVESAVISFQEKYKNEILVPAELEAGNGVVDGLTLAKLNALYQCNSDGTPAVVGQYVTNNNTSQVAGVLFGVKAFIQSILHSIGQ